MNKIILKHELRVLLVVYQLRFMDAKLVPRKS